MKQANADIEQASAIVELGLDLYAGDDDIVFPFLEIGGLGGVCVHTHVVGPQVKEMIPLSGPATSRRRARSTRSCARRSTSSASRRTRSRSRRPSASSDTMSAGSRLPLVEANAEEREAVRGCLERLGLLQPAHA